MRRRWVFPLFIALAVSGCEQQAEGQTVAIVNGEEITAAELNAEIASANLPPGIDKDAARSSVLQAMIDRRLLVQKARADGIDKSPEYLNRQRRQTEDLLIGMVASRQVNSTELPSLEQITAYQSSHPGKFAKREFWTLQQLHYPTPSDREVVAQITASDSMEEVEAALKAHGIPPTRSTSRLDTASLTSEIFQRIADLPPGEPFFFPVGNRTVASVIASRSAAALQGDEARPVAVAAIRRQEGSTLMEQRLKELRDTATITYQEGFAPAKPPQPPSTG